MSDGVVLSAVVAFGCVLAAFPLWLLMRGVKQGVWNGRGVNVFRSERPVAFWFGIVMYGVIAATILTFPLYVVWVTFTGR
jgi:hypothetical protein